MELEVGIRGQGSVVRGQESGVSTQGSELEFRVGVGGRVGVSTQGSGVRVGVQSWSWR